MRKAHMQLVIEGLQKRLKDVEHQRDQVLAELHKKADTTTTAIGKLGTDVSGLAEAVRASLLRQAEPEASPVTPVASKRGSKAAG